MSAHERHDDALLLNQLADEEVAPFDVLDPVMVLRVVREVARARVVRGELGWGPRREPQLREEVGKEDCLLRGLAERHDLGLARRQRDGRLLLAPPADRGLGVREDVTRGGVAHGPVGVAHAGHVEVAGAVAKSDVAMVVEVVQYAQRVEVQLRSRLAHSPTQHADGVGDVGTGVHSTVEQGTDETLVSLEERGVDGIGRLLHRREDTLWQILVCRRA